MLEPLAETTVASPDWTITAVHVGMVVAVVVLFILTGVLAMLGVFDSPQQAKQPLQPIYQPDPDAGTIQARVTQGPRTPVSPPVNRAPGPAILIHAHTVLLMSESERMPGCALTSHNGRVACLLEHEGQMRSPSEL